jgi:hypothetical protein
MTIIREEYSGEHAQLEKEYAEYERRSRAIDAWARAQYDAGKLSEFQIERAVERMFDELDAEYCSSRYVPDLYQTRADVDADDNGPYPGWTSMQSAMRDSW